VLCHTESYREAGIAAKAAISYTTKTGIASPHKFKQGEMTVWFSLKGYIFITTGQRPAEKLHNSDGCLKGRTCIEEFCLSGSRVADVPPQAALRLPAVMKIRSRRDKTVFVMSVIAGFDPPSAAVIAGFDPQSLYSSDLNVMSPSACAMQPPRKYH
jgi:hypothetical protein